MDDPIYSDGTLANKMCFIAKTEWRVFHSAMYLRGLDDRVDGIRLYFFVRDLVYDGF